MAPPGFVAPVAEELPLPAPVPPAPPAQPQPAIVAPYPAVPPPAPMPPITAVHGRDVAQAPPPRSEPMVDAFAHAPPFKPRVNKTKRWTLAAAAVAVLMLAGIGATQYFGTPNLLAWAGVGQIDVPLLLEVPRKPERRTLESGNELFAISGKVVNPTSEAQRVPDILAELRDAQGRVVYGWTITPPKRSVGPKASIDFNSAEVNVPKGARELNLSFSGA
jgi:hypothetical protein